MHSDRELLELAAKARGGIEVDEDFGLIDPEKDTATQSWNPLTDDGDALRLAVKLHISPSWSPSKKSVKASIENDPFLVFGIYATGDDCADVRRIIVMSAAAIGEAMQ